MIAATPPAVAATPFVPPLQTGDALPITALHDQRGRPFVLGGTAAGATVVTFFYTRCRDANECPLTSAKFARLQTLFANDPARLVEITLDPVHDTAAELARYGAAFGAEPKRWRLASGTPASTSMLERRLDVAVSRSAAGDFVHEDAVVVLDRDGRIADTIGGNEWAPSDIVSVARTAESLPSDPFVRLRFALSRGVAAACGGVSGARGVSIAGALVIFAFALGASGVLLRRVALGR